MLPRPKQRTPTTASMRRCPTTLRRAGRSSLRHAVCRRSGPWHGRTATRRPTRGRRTPQAGAKPDRAIPGELVPQPACGGAELAGQAGQGRRDPTDMLVGRQQPGLEIARDAGLVGRQLGAGRRRCRSRGLALGLALDPRLDDGVGQQLQERLDLLGRRLGRRLRQGRPPGQERGQQHDRHKNARPASHIGAPRAPLGGIG